MTVIERRLRGCLLKKCFCFYEEKKGLKVKYLACIFKVKIQSVSTNLKGISKYMYLRLGLLSYWLNRSVMIHSMPSVYTCREEFF